MKKNDPINFDWETFLSDDLFLADEGRIANMERFASHQLLSIFARAWWRSSNLNFNWNPGSVSRTNWIFLIRSGLLSRFPALRRWEIYRFSRNVHVFSWESSFHLPLTVRQAAEASRKSWTNSLTKTVAETSSTLTHFWTSSAINIPGALVDYGMPKFMTSSSPMHRVDENKQN